LAVAPPLANGFDNGLPVLQFLCWKQRLTLGREGDLDYAVLVGPPVQLSSLDGDKDGLIAGFVILLVTWRTGRWGSAFIRRSRTSPRFAITGLVTGPMSLTAARMHRRQKTLNFVIHSVLKKYRLNFSTN
jgi:hypothetical protein